MPSNLVSIVIQKPGEVPARKGPYVSEQVEPVLRELYRLYPGIVCIVMPGLPVDCYPQHGQEYLDMLEADRCKCEVDAPRNPKCSVDHDRCDREAAPRQRYLIRGRLLPLSENGVLQVGVADAVNIQEATHEVYLVGPG